MGLGALSVVAMLNSSKEPKAARPWAPRVRLGFRIAFIYFFGFMFCYGNGTLFSLFPWVGERIESALRWPIAHLAQWTGTQVFHLTGQAARWHPTGSGDTALHWITAGLLVAISLLGALLWTAAAHAGGGGRTEYRSLYAWLRFGLRLTCGMFMMVYGLGKVYPHQMAPISIAILNEPMGQTSPKTLLWALIGMNPWYEMVCGAAEVAGGALLLMRRTALAGALLSAFVMTNVVLYNFFFDVPVKLFAVNLLLSLLFLVLPDAPALARFFWKHEPAAPSGVWIPATARRGVRIFTRGAELLFVIGFLVYWPVRNGVAWFHEQAAARVATPLLGAWKVEGTHMEGGPFVGPDGLPITDLYIDSAIRAFSRSSEARLWRTTVKVDGSEHRVRLVCALGEPATYAWRMPDRNRLVLTPIRSEPPAENSIAKPSAPTVVTLTRVQVPDHYPLLDRGFHWVNEWGLER
jgi:hypothetical protein